jgi:hypothetical protein
MKRSFAASLVLLTVPLALFAACGDDGATPPPGDDAAIDAPSSDAATATDTGATTDAADGSTTPSTFTVGGHATGIVIGGTVTLRLNDSIDVPVTNAQGTYAFGTALASGTTYSVAVKTNPVGQSCTLAHATGIVANTPVTDVDVTCVDDSGVLSVDVTGYAGTTPLTLQNGADVINVTGNGVKPFPTKVQLGTGYSIGANAQPTLPYQDCTVGTVATPAAGTMTGGKTVPVSCVTKPFKVTGTLKGKRAPSVGLTSGAVTAVTVANNGDFQFPGTFPSGTVLSVAVNAAPGTQKCFVDGGATTVGNADVVVAVTCYDEVSFAGAGSPAVADFQVPLTLTAATFDYARAQAQGQDLRFFATHGGAAVPYYIESWNAAGDSRVWVKVPSVAAAGSTKLLMFAGDNALAAASSGDSTFELFDDFSMASVDTNKWELRGTPSVNSGAGGLLTFVGNSNWEYARSKTSFTSGVVEADFSTAGPSAGLILGNAGSDNRYTFRVSGPNDGTTFDNDVSGGNSWFDMNFPNITRGPDGVSRRETMAASVDVNNNIAVSQICNVTAAACSGSSTLTSSTGAAFFVGFGTYSGGYTIVMDRLFVRKLAAGVFTATLL